MRLIKGGGDSRQSVDNETLQEIVRSALQAAKPDEQIIHYHHYEHRVPWGWIFFGLFILATMVSSALR